MTERLNAYPPARPATNAMRKRLFPGRTTSLLQGLFLAPAIAVAILGVSVLFGQPAFAISIVPACAKTGLPDLNCAVTAFVNVARLIFSVTGSFALFMFIIGGFKILSSAGNDKKVSEGKEYIKNAVIGIFIILTAAYVIEYGYQRLTGVKGGGICPVDKKGVVKGSVFMQVTTDAKGNQISTQKCCPPSSVLLLNTKGVQECVNDCSQITTHKCVETKPGGKDRPEGQEGCIVGLCKGNKSPSYLCCPKL